MPEAILGCSVDFRIFSVFSVGGPVTGIDIPSQSHLIKKISTVSFNLTHLKQKRRGTQSRLQYKHSHDVDSGESIGRAMRQSSKTSHGPDHKHHQITPAFRPLEGKGHSESQGIKELTPMRQRISYPQFSTKWPTSEITFGPSLWIMTHINVEGNSGSKGNEYNRAQRYIIKESWSELPSAIHRECRSSRSRSTLSALTRTRDRSFLGKRGNSVVIEAPLCVAQILLRSNISQTHKNPQSVVTMLGE
ncbi:hypothetical protein WN51_13285 [Melipona quadrifasciata]|uniref:Uncharacterized protein n=1 Tax=Melipona quadrifasciata TaxID=166423 RepID=A0A0N0U5I8_9HYME|nr:hypothetical protein WN51_13285 [Melipona quadrifasciata]